MPGCWRCVSGISTRAQPRARNRPVYATCEGKSVDRKSRVRVWTLCFRLRLFLLMVWVHVIPSSGRRIGQATRCDRTHSPTIVRATYVPASLDENALIYAPSGRPPNVRHVRRVESLGSLSLLHRILHHLVQWKAKRVTALNKLRANSREKCFPNGTPEHVTDRRRAMHPWDRWGGATYINGCKKNV